MVNTASNPDHQSLNRKIGYHKHKAIHFLKRL